MIRYYYVVLGLFLLGGILMYRVNQSKEPAQQRANWLKFASYFVIVSLVLGSILAGQYYFWYLALLLAILGGAELFVLCWRAGLKLKTLSFLGLYTLAAIGFMQFASFSQSTLLFTYLLVVMFDGFSQLSGQLMGKYPILPRISPQKTVAGLLGGWILSVLGSFFFQELISGTWGHNVRTASILVLFAFAGDVAASFLKRKLGVKDFSQLLPGQGGILDRFDSLFGASIGVLILRVLGWL